MVNALESDTRHKLYFNNLTKCTRPLLTDNSFACQAGVPKPAGYRMG